MANFPPSDLLQWITRVHDAPRIFQICRTTFDRRFLPRAHHPISLRLMHHVYHCILSTRFIWSLRQWLFCSWYLSWSNLEESIDKIPIRIFTKKIYLLREWRRYGFPRRLKIDPQTGSDNRGTSSPPSGKGGEKEGRDSIEIVSRTVRRFDGRRVDILGRRAQHSSVIYFLPDLLTAGDAWRGWRSGSFPEWTRSVRAGNYFGIN